MFCRRLALPYFSEFINIHSKDEHFVLQLAGLIGGDGPTLKILVIKIPERAHDEEYLEMFFERKGDTVVNIQMFEEFSAAVVEFDDAEGNYTHVTFTCVPKQKLTVSL